VLALVVPIVAALAIASALAPAASAASLDTVRTPADPAYTVDLSADAAGSTWTGTESVTFTNVAAGSLSVVWIRLWDNGIAGCQQPLAIQVSNVTGGTAGGLSVGCTALSVQLTEPLGQGQQTTLGLDLAIRVPNRNDRFGRVDGVSMLGNAIPVIAVRDDQGWHLPPYVSFGESFYSQVGDFDVTLDVPDGMAVPATGDPVSRSHRDGRAVVTYRADDVRDFAWAAGPLREIEGPSPTGVAVRVWYPSSVSRASAEAALDTGKQAMAEHAARFGPYPYADVDIVLGQFTAFGGMEYPRFVMAVASDSVIVHELGHQWWYGLVGDDEYTDPWLDEAFASYATDLYYGDPGTSCRFYQFPSADSRVSNSMAYWSTHIGDYSLVVYGIGSCALHALGRQLGPLVMTRFIRSYAVANALVWSTTSVFQAAAQDVANGLPNPMDLTPFWHRWRIGPP
jgi:hypothetical protein